MMRILFVCMGNICRSPAAEGVFRALVDGRGLSDRIKIASAGTLSYHAGELPDQRMRRAARARGIDLVSRARHVQPADLDTFDYVLAMDSDNFDYLKRLCRTEAHHAKVRLLTDYHPDAAVDHVPDPYHGSAEGFDHVLDILEVACARLLDEVAAKLPPP